MILLDTDVVIDLLRGLPAAVEWFNEQTSEQFVLSATLQWNSSKDVDPRLNSMF